MVWGLGFRPKPILGGLFSEAPEGRELRNLSWNHFTEEMARFGVQGIGFRV